MYFESFDAFIAMGGHGLYVWVCYGIATAVIAVLFVQPMLRKHDFMKRQQAVLRRSAREGGQ